jgi:NADH-quinone oxidoreductase subunit C
VPDAPGLELIAQGIEEGRQGTIVETAFVHGKATVVIHPEGVLHALRWLRDQPGQRYTFLASLHAADYMPATPRFAVHYELLCRDRVERINLKVLLADPAAGEGSNGAEAPEKLPELDSCVALYPTAEFQEREAYDFFGILFKGHPDLRRIAMPEDFVGWPQRRDFPIGGEPVLYTHNEIETPRWYE